MAEHFSRRSFTAFAAGSLMGTASPLALAQEKKDPPKEKPKSNPAPIEAPFERDYKAPDFKPSWRNPQINRLLLQDFVIFSHGDLEMTKKLVEKEPGLAVSSINWGAGDWESGLGAASHVGRRDIVEMLLEHGARVDIFCATMLGMLDVVKAFLTLQPKLIDAKGPHGFSLHHHAQVGGKSAEPVLDYLQSIKKIEMKQKKAPPAAKKEKEK